MTDRELLELAAKAARYKMPHLGWNPLTDDGDALRLAVRLELDISQQPHMQRVVAMWEKPIGRTSFVSVDYEGDRITATRRAIVRAAAALA